VTYAWVAQYSADFSVHLMSQSLNICRSAFYASKKAPLSAKAEEDQTLTEVIKTSFNEGRECYGTRRIQQDLIDQELTVSRRRIGRLMKTDGMQVKTKRRRAIPTS
jgi:hypothetical protein